MWKKESWSFSISYQGLAYYLGITAQPCFKHLGLVGDLQICQRWDNLNVMGFLYISGFHGTRSSIKPVRIYFDSLQ